jgi:hypothetical protein
MSAGGWPHRYPPLIAVAVALVLVVFALPSALNLPQANPGQTLEYAPVPGDQGQTSRGGNIAGLGLGQGGGPGASGGSLDQVLAPPPPPLNGTGSTPSTKQCVGNPPRQTEDPLSPPCVAFFRGDNGGATYAGVTGREARVLVYSDSGFNYAGCNSDSKNPPGNRYYDLARPPDPSENTCVTRAFRVWQSYFNQRYQTYGRTIHFWVYFSPYGGSGDTPAARRADAADNIAHVQPFASLLGFNVHGNQNDYMDAVARRGITYFTSQDFKSKGFYQKYAPQLWGYAPSLEEKASTYAGYICREVAPNPVSFSGNRDTGAPRVYGLLETTDSAKPELRQFQDLVRDKVQGCGVRFKVTKYYPVDGFIAYTGPSSQSYASYAQPAMADMQAQGVTTLIWPAGFENQFSQAAASLHYYPEWVTGGDGVSDGYTSTTSQNGQVWSHAVVASTSLLLDRTRVEAPCRQAYLDTYPQATDVDLGFACRWYASLRQLFTGIQVAGPRLTPQAMDQGYHAIPPKPSTSPQVPACYYEAGDYTCVKDAIQMYWDPTAPNADAVPHGPTSANTQGCWRVVAGGRRYTAGQWPGQDPAAQRTSSDPCNGFAGDRIVYAAQPGTG